MVSRLILKHRDKAVDSSRDSRDLSTPLHALARVFAREREGARVTKETRGREARSPRCNGRRGNDSDWENARLEEDARWRGKGSEFRATGGTGTGSGSRARGVEADAHRVPAVNVDYARALNLCACIRERALWTWPFLRRGLKSVQGETAARGVDSG